MNVIKKIALFLVVSIACGTMLFGQTIVDVEWKGLKRTKQNFVAQFVKQTIDQPFDSIAYQKDIQTIRNLNLFYQVESEVIDSLDGVKIQYRVKESLSILPIINFGGISENFWFQLGAIDHNFVGMGAKLAGYYRYYDRHSFHVFYQMPFLPGSKWGISSSVLHLATVEPIFFSEGTTDFNYDNWVVELLPRYNFNYRHFIEWGGAFLREKYQATNIDEVPMGVNPEFGLNKGLVKIAHQLDRIDYLDFYRSGWSSVSGIESVYTPVYKDFFWKIQWTGRYFKRIGKTGNLAFRIRSGIAENEDTPFPPFVLDSYINIRGAGNRVNRGSGELVVNSEYRQTILDLSVGAIQLVGFTDIGGWRLAGQSWKTLRDTKVFFSGIGARIIIKPIYRLVLRLDYGVHWFRPKERGFVFGLGQYF